MSDVREFDKADYGLLPLPAESWGFLVFVASTRSRRRSPTQLGDLPGASPDYRLDDWRGRAQKRYEVAANYKLVAENFMEYYHLPWVHPELVKVSRIEAHYRWQGPGCTREFARARSLRTPRAAAGWGCHRWHAAGESDAESAASSGVPEHGHQRAPEPHLRDGHRIPSARIALSRRRLSSPTRWPRQPRMRRGSWISLMGFWDLVNRRTSRSSSACRRASPIRPTGRPDVLPFEETLHRFQNMIVDRMVGIDRVPPGDEEEQVPMFPEPQTVAP